MSGPLARLFLDSNVLTGGIVANWGLDRGVLSLCAARICRLVLAEVVREEVEHNLLMHVAPLDEKMAGKLLADYDRLLKLTRPEVVPYPTEDEVRRARPMIRHLADVPVLVSAMNSRPDWLLTHNTKHFSPSVAARSNVRISTPYEFFRTLSARFGGTAI